MNPAYLSLFSGCGGLDIGFAKAGYNSLGSVDIDSKALQTLSRNINTKAIRADLSHNESFSVGRKQVHVVLSGAPCQGFSTAGRRKLDDPRNSLLLTGGKIAIENHCTVFICENVTGVISGEHRKYWESLLGLFRTSGYSSKDFTLEFEKLGLAQIRKRRILLAWKSKRQFNPIIPRYSFVPLKTVLSGLEDSNDHLPKYIDPKSNDYLIAKRILPNQKLSNVRSGPRSVHTWDIPEVFGETSDIEKSMLNDILRLRRQERRRSFGDADPVSFQSIAKIYGAQTQPLVDILTKKGYLKPVGDYFDLVHTFNGLYRRLSYDLPSHTVDTRFTSPRMFLHPVENRGMTVREAARIQGFPDSFNFYGSETEQIRQIGNAVPPIASEILAPMIKEVFYQ